MAGFEVSINGRIWASTEGLGFARSTDGTGSRGKVLEHSMDICHFVTVDDVLGLIPEAWDRSLSEDSTGNPVVLFVPFTNVTCLVLFGSYSDGRAERLQFRCNFGEVLTLTGVNEFNRTRNFLKAYIDVDECASVEYDVSLNGGTTSDYLKEAFWRWMIGLQGFCEFLQKEA